MPVRARAGWTTTVGETKVTVRNVDALIRNFYELDQEIDDELRALAEHYAELIHDETFRTAPYAKDPEPPWHPGYMREHIRTRFTPSGLGFEIGWDEADTDAIGENFYFKFHELTGWTDRRGVFHPPTPSLQPAYELYHPEYQKAVAAMLRGRVRRRSAR